MTRTVLKVCGESGMGLRSVGHILTQSLKRLGYYVHADREYPSLIKGGHSMVQIDFDLEPVMSLSTQADIQIALDYPALMAYFDTVKKGGVLLHSFDRHEEIEGLQARAKKKGIQLIYLPARSIAQSLGGNAVVINMVMIGFVWGVLGFDLKPLEDAVRKQFAHKPKILEIDLKCIRAGYELEMEKNLVPDLDLPRPKSVPDKILLDGNTALSLGAIQCGVRAYYAYPMSPASSILTDLAKFAQESGMLVKQAEDEITAAQMTVGSMHMGTRAFTATSGGGVDLMAETISLAAITETPLVIGFVQRTGPGTGLPTWSGQTGLNLAIHGAHGEFPVVVMACSDPTSCYELIQHAMNLAEEYQLQVMLMSEKVVAEAQAMVDPFEHKKIPIKRGLVTKKAELAKLTSSDRYKITKSGVSKRWLPGSGGVHYFANGDEHWEDGTVTEDGDEASKMVAKRMRKLESVTKVLPEPVVYGPAKDADVSFVGWGSTKNAMMDVIAHFKHQGVKVNYLHYEYLYPLKTKRFEKFVNENKTVCLAEGNYMGQLGEMLENKTSFEFKKKFLKYNGRPFFFDEVIGYVNQMRT